MFITYKDVHDSVLEMPEGSIVGVCGDPTACLIAAALDRKYPAILGAQVALDNMCEDINISATTKVGWEEVLTGDDSHKLYLLATSFDDLQDPNTAKPTIVTREQALELFK